MVDGRWVWTTATPKQKRTASEINTRQLVLMHRWLDRTPEAREKRRERLRARLEYSVRDMHG